VPAIRVRSVNGSTVRGGGRFVLYWMTAFRQASRNIAVDRAVEVARERRQPLLVLEERLAGYGERSHPDENAGSGLSPWLHFGHVSVHEVFACLARREGWRESRLGEVTGSRTGFWGMCPEAESFLHELVTWRELGFNMASKRPDCDR